MNIKKRIYPLAASLLLLAACNNAEEMMPDGNSNFPADGVIRVAATTTDATTTRAGMTTDNLNRFFLNVKGASDTYSYYAMMGKCDTLGTAVADWRSYAPASAFPFTPTTMLWQNKTTPINVTGVALHGTVISKENFANGITASIQTDQTTEENVQKSDLLYMPSTEVDPTNTDHLTSKGKIKVTLAHRLSKLKLTLSLGTEFNPVSPNPISDLAINNTVVGYRFNANNNELTVNKEDVTPVKPLENTTAFTPGNGTTYAVASYEAILVPQEILMQRFSVSFTLRGKSYSWTSTTIEKTIFKAGKQYTLALKVGKDSVTIGGITSGDPWTNGEEMPPLGNE